MGAAVSSPSPAQSASPPVSSSSSVPSLSSPVPALPSPCLPRSPLLSVPPPPLLSRLPPAPSPFTELPLSLVCAIVAFASNNATINDVDDMGVVTSTTAAAADSRARTLHTLARVSRAWLAVARSIRRADRLRAFTIDASTLQDAIASPPAQLRLLEQLALQRASLRELSIEIGGSLVVSGDVWDAVLANAPLLDTLCIRPAGTPPSALPDAVLPLLDAAARQCPKLQSLLLTNIRAVFRPLPSTTDAMHVPALVQVLERGFQHWRHHVRELKWSIPFYFAPDRALWATRYVEALAQNCSHLERVGSYKEGFDRAMPRHAETWRISLATWERFCASCSELTAFDWEPVPVATSFFEVFGRFPKPQLTSLALRCSGEWQWDEYCRQYPELAGSDFGPTAEHPEAVFAACPALRRLHVVAPYLSARFPEFQWMYVRDDLFGDAFCETLAHHCRQLEQFEISSEHRKYGTAEARTIATFTDAALRALATLPRLSRVCVNTVNISGDGLFALVAESAWSHEWRVQREFSMAVGGADGSPYATRFYDVVKKFLTRLATSRRRDGGSSNVDGQTWTSARVLLRLRNSNLDLLPRSLGYDDVAWTRQYLAQLVRLIRTVKRFFPELRLRVVLQNARYGGTHGTKLVGFCWIQEFCLYSTDAKLPPYDDWDRGPVGDPAWMRTLNRPIDDVLMKRGEDLVVPNARDDDIDDDDNDDESEGVQDGFVSPPSDSDGSDGDGSDRNLPAQFERVDLGTTPPRIRPPYDVVDTDSESSELDDDDVVY